MANVEPVSAAVLAAPVKPERKFQNWLIGNRGLLLVRSALGVSSLVSELWPKQ